MGFSSKNMMTKAFVAFSLLLAISSVHAGMSEGSSKNIPTVDCTTGDKVTVINPPVTKEDSKKDEATTEDDKEPNLDGEPVPEGDEPEPADPAATPAAAPGSAAPAPGHIAPAQFEYLWMALMKRVLIVSHSADQASAPAPAQAAPEGTAVVPETAQEESTEEGDESKGKTILDKAGEKVAEAQKAVADAGEAVADAAEKAHGQLNLLALKSEADKKNKELRAPQMNMRQSGGKWIPTENDNDKLQLWYSMTWDDFFGVGNTEVRERVTKFEWYPTVNDPKWADVLKVKVADPINDMSKLHSAMLLPYHLPTGTDVAGIKKDMKKLYKVNDNSQFDCKFDPIGGEVEAEQKTWVECNFILKDTKWFNFVVDESKNNKGCGDPCLIVLIAIICAVLVGLLAYIVVLCMKGDEDDSDDEDEEEAKLVFGSDVENRRGGASEKDQ